MEINTQFKESLGPKAPKEMLSVTTEKVRAATGNIWYDRTVVRINSSSLEIIQTCKRKAYFALHQKLVGQEDSPALLFGTAIHKALEVWYTYPRVQRNGSIAKLAIDAFHGAAAALNTLDATDKRHPSNGEKTLESYFEKYKDDPFEVMSDDKGPIVERRFEFEIYCDEYLRIIVFGTIDVVLKNVETGTLIVADHKTTSALGTDFYQRCKPNHQYTCYVMGAQKALGLTTDLFMVNGLQVAKTKKEFARQVTQRTTDDLNEFTQAVLWAVRAYLDDTWPMGPVSACAMWGGCSYRQICEVPASLRQNVIEAMFVKKGEKSE